MKVITFLFPSLGQAIYLFLFSVFFLLENLINKNKSQCEVELWSMDTYRIDKEGNDSKQSVGIKNSKFSGSN